jgi:uncharacterized protein
MRQHTVGKSKAENGFPAVAGPVRTCIGCRRTDARSELMRLVKTANAAGEPAALADLRRRLPGRGAWLHPTADCLGLAIKRRAIGRALAGVTDVSDVEARIAELSGNG